jgi:hypothetical protein
MDGDPDAAQTWTQGDLGDVVFENQLDGSGDAIEMISGME